MTTKGKVGVSPLVVEIEAEVSLRLKKKQLYSCNFCWTFGYIHFTIFDILMITLVSNLQEEDSGSSKYTHHHSSQIQNILQRNHGEGIYYFFFLSPKCCKQSNCLPLKSKSATIWMQDLHPFSDSWQRIIIIITIVHYCCCLVDPKFSLAMAALWLTWTSLTTVIHFYWAFLAPFWIHQPPSSTLHPQLLA